jgi:predicted permease
VVSQDYFQTLGIPLHEGRIFEPSDRLGAPVVVVVNRSLARRHWGKESPLGRRLSTDGGQSWRTVVGVVGDVKQHGLAAEVRDEMYLAHAQFAGYFNRLLVRSAVPPARLGRLLRQAVHRIAPEQPVAELQTLLEVRAHSLEPPRRAAALLGLFAALAVAITATGLTGLLAYSVARRRHEIGVRMALGAEQGRVLREVLRQGLGLAAGGLALGVVLGLALGGALRRGLAGVLFEVEPTDPWTFGAVAALLLGVAAVASLVPARRATSVDPAEALRVE